MTVGQDPSATSHQAFRSADQEATYFYTYDQAMAMWPVPYDSADIPTDYGMTRLYTAGPDTAPPLVLLHGRAATSAMWFANVEALSGQHRVHAIDTMGEPGRSIHDGTRIRDRAAFMTWLDAVLAETGIGRADFCGASFGGWLALNYALHSPQRVAKLVLLDPVNSLAPLTMGFMLRAARLARPTREKLYDFFRWEAAGCPVEQRWLDLVVCGLADFPSSRPVFPRRPSARRLGALSQPALALLPANGVVHNASRGAARVRRLMPHGTARILPGTSHNLSLDDPEVVNRQILDFLQA